jgi:hypothetical protein
MRVAVVKRANEKLKSTPEQKANEKLNSHGRK